MPENVRNMTLGEFQERVDRLGTDFTRWSPEDVEPAWALLGQSDRARQLLREADELGALFKATSRVKAPAGLVDRILAQASADPQSEDAFTDNSAPCPNTSDTNAPPPQATQEAASISDNFSRKHVARS